MLRLTGTDETCAYPQQGSYKGQAEGEKALSAVAENAGTDGKHTVVFGAAQPLACGAEKQREVSSEAEKAGVDKVSEVLVVGVIHTGTEGFAGFLDVAGKFHIHPQGEGVRSAA